MPLTKESLDKLSYFTKKYCSGHSGMSYPANEEFDGPNLRQEAANALFTIIDYLSQKGPEYRTPYTQDIQLASRDDNPLLNFAQKISNWPDRVLNYIEIYRADHKL